MKCDCIPTIIRQVLTELYAMYDLCCTAQVSQQKTGISAFGKCLQYQPYTCAVFDLHLDIFEHCVNEELSQHSYKTMRAETSLMPN